MVHEQFEEHLHCNYEDFFIIDKPLSLQILLTGHDKIIHVKENLFMHHNLCVSV